MKWRQAASSPCWGEFPGGIRGCRHPSPPLSATHIPRAKHLTKGRDESLQGGDFLISPALILPTSKRREGRAGAESGRTGKSEHLQQRHSKQSETPLFWETHTKKWHKKLPLPGLYQSSNTQLTPCVFPRCTSTPKVKIHFSLGNSPFPVEFTVLHCCPQQLACLSFITSLTFCFSYIHEVLQDLKTKRDVVPLE